MVQIFAEMPSDPPEEIFEDLIFGEHAHQATPLPIDCQPWFKFSWFLFSR